MHTGMRLSLLQSTALRHAQTLGLPLQALESRRVCSAGKYGLPYRYQEMRLLTTSRARADDETGEARGQGGPGVDMGLRSNTTHRETAANSALTATQFPGFPRSSLLYGQADIAKRMVLVCGQTRPFASQATAGGLRSPWTSQQTASPQGRLPHNVDQLRSALSKADNTQHAADTVVQAALYEALLTAGYYREVLARYERQPQLGAAAGGFASGIEQSEYNGAGVDDVEFRRLHIQADPTCIAAYLAAARQVSPSALQLAQAKVRNVLDDYNNINNTQQETSGSQLESSLNNGFGSYNGSYHGGSAYSNMNNSINNSNGNGNGNGNGIHLEPREFQVQFNQSQEQFQPQQQHQRYSRMTTPQSPSRQPQPHHQQQQQQRDLSRTFPFSLFNSQPYNQQSNNSYGNGRPTHQMQSSSTSSGRGGGGGGGGGVRLGAISNNGSPQNNSGNNQGPVNGTPVNVVLTEVYSWKRYAFQLFSKILVIVLMGTGIMMLFDQQGILKNGISGLDIQPDAQKQKIKFVDVQGCDEAKAELEEVVDFLKNPDKFLEIGGRLPRGILLYGPPGTGKTHLARAVAGEASVPFFQMSGSEFDELYVGVGARRVRELFAAARKQSPCIIFIDEIDAVGSKRNARDQSHMRQTLNQLLTELDGFHPEEGIIFIGATNTPDALDKALTRPGRMDKLVPVPLPDVTGRTKILQVHLHKVRTTRGVDPTVIARGTPGLSGADLANLVNQAAVRATRMKADGVRMEDLEWAKDKIQMGAERKSAVISSDDKRRTAIHEGGHTLAAVYTPGATPLHKVTVMPRGNALGITHFLPEADQNSKTKQQLEAQLVVAMGGLAAEELLYGREGVTTGPAGDLKTARSVAIDMILTAGMSDKIGFGALGDSLDSLSPGTRAEVELEVKTKLDTALARARKILKDKRKELDLLSDALVQHETLTSDEVHRVIKGEKIIPISDKLRDATNQVEQEESDNTGNRRSNHNQSNNGGKRRIRQFESPIITVTASNTADQSSEPIFVVDITSNTSKGAPRRHNHNHESQENIGHK